ncbi:acetyl-CoA carboxylase carboxyltransferase subunit alpha [bacterium]|nr:acetyl-CoA carboxylase carboxyltransferase subunit alpha [bacterium]
MSEFVLEFEKPMVELRNRINELRALQKKNQPSVEKELTSLEKKLENLQKKVYSGLSRWERVQVARHPRRPLSMDYIKYFADDFIELHGDRNFGDDKALIAGLCKISGRKVVFIGQEKGRDTKDKLYRNFGMMHPEGYRKALRIMKMGEKFGLPVVILIDTPGAYPGVGAEERGQAEAIARNQFEMAKLRTPIVIVIIGEGASGGALGIGLGDVVLMMENGWYSVISPEGCAAILWRDRAEAPKAAEALRLSSADLLKMGMIDRIIPEPPGGAHWHPEAAMENVKKEIVKEIDRLKLIPFDELLESRINKYRNMGKWINE